MAVKPLKIMVSSTVYGSESDLDVLHAILEGFGYEVVMSKDGSVYVPVGFTPEQACLKAVEDCDLFLGIVFPRYGSGITHKEFTKAQAIDVPRWFVAHDYVTFARKLLQPYLKKKSFKFVSTSVMDNIKVIDMYNEIKTNWAQGFFKFADILPFINTQFKDMDQRRIEIEAAKLARP
jgi:hypothetical protein